MQTFYEILGISVSASAEEVRRSYRILARRYHPDLNPSNSEKNSEIFRKICQAYETLSNPEKRRSYDSLIPESKTFSQKNQKKTDKRQAARKYSEASYSSNKSQSKVRATIQGKNTPEKNSKIAFLFNKFNPFKGTHNTSSTKISVLEVSVSIMEAIYGTKKTVELEEPEGIRKLSINLPVGMRTGSVIRLKDRNNTNEEILVIIRVSPHPFLSIQTKGLIYEVPISVSESILGANFTIPSLDEDLSLKIPPGTSSGDEIRVPSKGLYLKDNSRGDLFIKFMVITPNLNDQIGLKDLARSIEVYYKDSVRAKLSRELF